MFDSVRLDDQFGRDAVAHVAELLDFGGRACARHDDLAELKRVGFEHEVLRESPGLIGDARVFGL